MIISMENYIDFLSADCPAQWDIALPDQIIDWPEGTIIPAEIFCLYVIILVKGIALGMTRIATGERRTIGTQPSA